jgi:hypothetical protein
MPSFQHSFLETIQPQPIVLKVEAAVHRRRRGAVQQTMVGDDGCEAAEVAVTNKLLPIRVTEHAIEVYQCRR